MKFLVGGNIIDSSSAVAADYVIAALELAVGIELFTVLGLFRYGADTAGVKRVTSKCHRTRNFMRPLLELRIPLNSRPRGTSLCQRIAERRFRTPKKYDRRSHTSPPATTLFYS
jgi:hypothetical protein